MVSDVRFTLAALSMSSGNLQTLYVIMICSEIECFFALGVDFHSDARMVTTLTEFERQIERAPSP